MDHDQKFCLQSLKDELDNCVDKEVDIDNGKKKTSEEVNRLTKTPITAEKKPYPPRRKSPRNKNPKRKKDCQILPYHFENWRFWEHRITDKDFECKSKKYKMTFIANDHHIIYHLGAGSEEKYRRWV